MSELHRLSSWTKHLSPEPLVAEAPRSTGVTSVLRDEKEKENVTLWHANKNKPWAVHRWWPLLSFRLFGYKANRAALSLDGVRANTGCCDVCGEWVGCDVDIPHPEPTGLFFNLAGWDVLSNQVPSHPLPSPPPQAHLLSPDNPTNSFHCCLLWPLTSGALSCPVERGRFKRLPGSVQ